MKGFYQTIHTEPDIQHHKVFQHMVFRNIEVNFCNNGWSWKTFDFYKKNLFSYIQDLLKGAILCFRNLSFYFRHGESTSTASQLTSPASKKSKDLNKVSLLLQDLDWDTVESSD